MKYLLSIILITLVFSLNIYAQETLTEETKEKPHFIQISAGLSSPVDKYKSEEMAKDGLLLSLDAALFITRNIGVGVAIHSGANEMTPFYIDYGTRATADDPYGIAFFGAGVYLELPLSKFFRIKAKAVPGYLHGVTPDLHWKTQIWSEDYWAGEWSYYYDSGTIKSSNGGGFGLNLGAGARFRLGKLIGLNLDFNYLYGRPQMTVNNIKTNLEYSTINGSFGVSFSF